MYCVWFPTLVTGFWTFFENYPYSEHPPSGRSCTVNTLWSLLYSEHPLVAPIQWTTSGRSYTVNTPWWTIGFLLLLRSQRRIMSTVSVFLKFFVSNFRKLRQLKSPKSVIRNHQPLPSTQGSFSLLKLTNKNKQPGRDLFNLPQAAPPNSIFCLNANV